MYFGIGLTQNCPLAALLQLQIAMAIISTALSNLAHMTAISLHRKSVSAAKDILLLLRRS